MFLTPCVEFSEVAGNARNFNTDVHCFALVLQQEDVKVDEVSYSSLESKTAIKMVRSTRMGGWCYPRRRGAEPGSQTQKRPGTWGGSEFTSFAVNRGYITNTHVDVFEADGERVYPPSVGILTAVNRNHVGPAKRAIVVCADDREAVVEALRLDLSERTFRQYSGPMKTLEGLASVLREKGLRFVVMEFPAGCSYILPAGCAHMFVTLGLIESVVWHPSLV